MVLAPANFSATRKPSPKIEWMKLQNKSVIGRRLERTVKERENRVQ